MAKQGYGSWALPAASVIASGRNFTMLLNALERALSIQQEDVQELAEELLSEQGLRSRSTSLLSNQGMPVPSVTFTTENDSVLRKCTTLTKG